MAGRFKAFVGQLLPNNRRRKKCERTRKKVENSDLLLSQIDEFREKAQQLQSLLLSKESKAKELQSLVEERNEKAEELQQILEERQEKADGITAEVGHKIDEMIVKISQKMNEISASMKEDLDNGRQVNEEQAAIVKESVQAGSSKAEETLAILGHIKEELIALRDNISGTKTELLAIKEVCTSVKEECASVKEECTSVKEECVSVKEECSAVKDDMAAMKEELLEKVHSENVKCYRNIQDLMKGLEDQIEKIEVVNQNTKSIRGFSKFLMWISIINFLTLVGFILYAIGVFNFI